MRPPRLWWDEQPMAGARLLQPLGSLYGRVAARRMRRPGERAPVPVICIGNFTVGGAGKTPAALALAKLLAAAGESPCFLTRGYGGRLPGPVRVDPTVHDAADVGDEPLLLARRAPTIVARRRPAGAGLAAAEGASLILMDDGLQNPSLAKDLAFAVVDSAVGIGNGLCVPAGPLRAPLEAQWRAVHALVLIGAGARGEALAKEAARQDKPVFRGRLVPDPAAAERLRGRAVYAFAGIGRPEKFFATLAECGAVVARSRAFPDHHRFRAAEIEALLGEARKDGLVPVTTEKDLARLQTLPEVVSRPVETLPVTLSFSDLPQLATFIAQRLRHRRS